MESRTRSGLRATVGVCLWLAGWAGVIHGATESTLTHAPAGFSCHEYYDESGYCTRYLLFRPYQPSQDGRYPLILFLNGLGENGDDGVSQLSNNLGHAVWAARYRFPFMIVAPQMSPDSSWQRLDSAVASAAMRIIDQVCEQLGGDSSRVYVTGPSSGGAGTISLADRYSERFAAAVPVAAGDWRPLPGMPIWTFLNQRDRKSLVEGAEAGFLARIQQGDHPLITLYAVHGHNAWTNAYQDPAMYQWLLRHHLPRSSPAPRFQSIDWPLSDSIPLGNLGAADDRSQAAQGKRFDTESQGSASHGSMSEFHLPLLGNQLHFQYRSSRKQPLEVWWWRWDERSEPAWRPAGRLHLSWPEDGSSFVQREGGVAYGDPLAERSLRVDGWNDVGLVRSGSEVEVYVNGWRLLRAAGESSDDGSDHGELAEQVSGSLTATAWSIGWQSHQDDPAELIRAVRVGPADSSTGLAPRHWQSDRLSNGQSPLAVGSPAVEAAPDQGPQLNLTELIAGWQRWEQQWEHAEVIWRRQDRGLPVQWFFGEVDDQPALAGEQRLALHGEKFLWQSIRPFQESPVEGWRVADLVVRYLPERTVAPFIHHLYSRFREQPARQIVQPLVRQFDGQQVMDWWQPVAGAGQEPPLAPSRIRIHALPRSGEAEAALMQWEQHPNDRCASLELSAALLALRPLSCPIHPVDIQGLQVLPTSAIVDGVECWRLTDREIQIDVASEAERTAKPKYRRMWLVSREYPYSVQRYWAEAGNRGVQIDLHWTGQGPDRRLRGGRYLLFQTDGSPTSYFGQMQVVQVGPAERPWQTVVTLDAVPEGTWVADDQTHEQYLTESSGGRRVIATDELAWLPTYEELRSSGGYHVRWQVYRRILPRVIGEYRWWLFGGAIGLMGLVLAVVRLHRRWGKVSSTAARTA